VAQEFNPDFQPFAHQEQGYDRSLVACLQTLHLHFWVLSREPALAKAFTACRTSRTALCHLHCFWTSGHTTGSTALSWGTLLLYITHFHKFVGIYYLPGLLSPLTKAGHRVAKHSGPTQTHTTWRRTSCFLSEARDRTIFFTLSLSAWLQATHSPSVYPSVNVREHLPSPQWQMLN